MCVGGLNYIHRPNPVWVLINKNQTKTNRQKKILVKKMDVQVKLAELLPTLYSLNDSGELSE